MSQVHVTTFHWLPALLLALTFMASGVVSQSSPDTGEEIRPTLTSEGTVNNPEISLSTDDQAALEAELSAARQDVEEACCVVPSIDCKMVMAANSARRSNTVQSKTAQIYVKGGHFETLLDHTDKPLNTHETNVNGSNSSKQDMETREEINSSKLVGYLEASNSSSNKVRRHRRQVNLIDSFIDRLGINLLRFESCLCQSLPGSTCRMLFPPDFYQQSLPSNFFNNQQNNMQNMPNNGPATFLVAFQDESGVKTFNCAFYQDAVVDCILMNLSPVSSNNTEQIQQMVDRKDSIEGNSCLICNPLYCTFQGFKRKLNDADVSFNNEHTECLAERLQVPSPPTTTTTTTTTTQPPVSRPPIDTGGSRRTRLTVVDLYRLVFPSRVKQKAGLSVITGSGIFLGLGSIAGNTSLGDRYSIRPAPTYLFHPEITLSHGDHDHKHHHDDKDKDEDEEPVDHVELVISSVVGGVLVGMLLMLLLVLLLLRCRRKSKKETLAHSRRSLRGLPILRLDVLDPSPYCGAPQADPVPAAVPPVARVVPMSKAKDPRRTSMPEPPVPPPSLAAVEQKRGSLPVRPSLPVPCIPLENFRRPSMPLPEDARPLSIPNCQAPGSPLDRSPSHRYSRPFENQLDPMDPESWQEEGDCAAYRGIYSSVDDVGDPGYSSSHDVNTSLDVLEEVSAELEKPSPRPFFRNSVAGGCDNPGFDNYEVPVIPRSASLHAKLRPKKKPPPIPVRSATTRPRTNTLSGCSDTKTWDLEERGRELEALEHDYMEIQPDPGADLLPDQPDPHAYAEIASRSSQDEVIEFVPGKTIPDSDYCESPRSNLNAADVCEKFPLLDRTEVKSTQKSDAGTQPPEGLENKMAAKLLECKVNKLKASEHLKSMTRPRTVSLSSFKPPDSENVKQMEIPDLPIPRSKRSKLIRGISSNSDSGESTMEEVNPITPGVVSLEEEDKTSVNNLKLAKTKLKRVTSTDCVKS